MSTVAYQLAEIRTEGHLAEIVASARAAGHSWRAISRTLHADYGVDVSDNTLRVWFAGSQS